MRVCIAGAGLAGSLLAWRLAGSAPDGWTVQLLTGRTVRDATAVSGGAVRAYETDPGQRRQAAESLAELLASPVLRDWAGYRPAAAVTLRSSADGLAGAAADIEAVLPGSASMLDAAALERLGFADLPDGATGLLERTAGWLSPARFRAALLADRRLRRRVAVRETELGALTPRLARDHDLVVLALGPWTPAFLGPATGYRTKAVQYAVHPVAAGLPPQFVDGLTDLFGRPTEDGGLLLGLPTDRWDVDPAHPPLTAELPGRAAALARARFPALRLGPAGRPVIGADCYTDGPGLALRPVPGIPALFTFTGGAGGSAKTALAASRLASAQLLATGPHSEPTPAAPTEGRR